MVPVSDRVVSGNNQVSSRFSPGFVKNKHQVNMKHSSVEHDLFGVSCTRIFRVVFLRCVEISNGFSRRGWTTKASGPRSTGRRKKERNEFHGNRNRKGRVNGNTRWYEGRSHEKAIYSPIPVSFFSFFLFSSLRGGLGLFATVVSHVRIVGLYSLFLPVRFQPHKFWIRLLRSNRKRSLLLFISLYAACFYFWQEEIGKFLLFLFALLLEIEVPFFIFLCFSKQ